MSPRLSTLRRWLPVLGNQHIASTSPILSADDYRIAIRCRLDLLNLEDRNAPGSLLGELLAAALTVLDPAPLDLLPDESDSNVVPPLAPTSSRLTISGIVEEPTPADPGSVSAPEAEAEASEAANAPTGQPATVAVEFALDPTSFLPVPPAISGIGTSDRRSMATDEVAAGSPGGGVSVRVPAASFAPTSAPTTDLPEPKQNLILWPRHSIDPATSSAITRQAESDEAEPLTSLGGVSVDGDGAGRTANFETIVELPPNTAPVANDDTAVVDEDGYVIIDVLANDTDADTGDVLRIDSWDWQPANGTVTQEADGKLKYTPTADFDDPYGSTETFTYHVSDGRDLSNTATVTITFNSINDTPVGFNDAYSHINYAATDPEWDPETNAWYMPTISGSVLDNDFDVEINGALAADPLTGIYAIDTTGTVGTIHMDFDSGEFSWEGPYDFLGETSFKYQAVDYDGGITNWATVLLWTMPDASAVPPPPPPPPITANGDLFTVGEESQTFNVMANDSGGYVAVLTEAPGVGITGFGFNGTASYSPRGVPIAGQFHYRIFAPGGVAEASATVQNPKINLEIFHGQGGNALREENEEQIGAFTVANTNDTDGDGKRDSEDDWVATNSSKSAVGIEDEVDLMKLVVWRPNVPIQQQGPITLTLVGGKAKVFKHSTKANAIGGESLPILSFPGNNYTIPPGDFTIIGESEPAAALTFWVEVFEPVDQLRSVEIRMSYGTAPNISTDWVRATGVWAHFNDQTGFHANGQKGFSNDSEYFQLLFTQRWSKVNGFELGKPPMMTPNFNPFTGANEAVLLLRNGMEMEFTVVPDGVEKELGGKIRFDISRAVEARAWLQKAGQAIAELKAEATSFPAFAEHANDDSDGTDEDTSPTNQHIYSQDFPGAGPPLTPAEVASGDYSKGNVRYVMRMNAIEFVRVSLTGTDFHADPVLGGNIYLKSRASEFVDWRSWIDFAWDGKAWLRTANTPENIYNEMTLGQRRDLNTPPLPGA